MNHEYLGQNLSARFFGKTKTIHTKIKRQCPTYPVMTKELGKNCYSANQNSTATGCLISKWIK